MHTLLNRTATLAIAATVAFSSLPLLAQDAPATELPVETTTTAEPVAAEPAPESVATDSHAGHSAEPAPAASAASKPRAKAQAKASAQAAKVAPARTETSITAPELNSLGTPTIAPVSEAIAEPTAATVAPVVAAPNGDLERAAFASILALLALGGAASVVSRRRRAHRVADRPAVHDVAGTTPLPGEPVAVREPVRHAPSAFAWGRRAPVEAPTMRAGGSWTERARRGPTPDNPSLSLKKRLKRAAFYEQRERAVAAGRAKQVMSQAGLPRRAIENLRPGWAPHPVFIRAFQPA